jgi:hypothetical protein
MISTAISNGRHHRSFVSSLDSQSPFININRVTASFSLFTGKTRAASVAAICSLLVLLFLIPPTAPAASRAKYAGEFLAIGIGGRALGLGGAYAALASDVTAGYWNPAGLSALEYPQIALMHDERFGGLVNYDYGAVALPMGQQSTLGISFIRLGVDNIPDTRYARVDANGNPLPPGDFGETDLIDPSRITYFNAADWALFLSYARSAGSTLSYGVNCKLIRRDNDGESATGIGFDIGARYFVTPRFILGANLQDATTTLVAWSTGTNELISPTLKLGSAYRINAFDGVFSPAGDVDVRFDNRKSASNAHIGAVSFDFHGGLEFDFRSLVAVRAGYSDIGSFNFGAGIHLPKFDIDYSFAQFNDADQLGNTHRISLTFTLQAEQFKRSAD